MVATNGNGRHAEVVLHCTLLPKEVHRVPVGSSTVWCLLFCIELVAQCSRLSRTSEVHGVHTLWNYDLKMLHKGYCIRVDHSKKQCPNTALVITGTSH
jgi:hypothetical protein